MKKILVVDDLEDYLEAIEGMLWGEYEVLKARDKKEAMEVFENERVDAAIIDIRLDEEDAQNKEGLDVLKWIKKKNPDFPVIIMSAYKEFDYAVEALNAGASYFLKKPLKPDELLNILSGILK